jgi:ABC-type transporter Mla MlaB component
MPTIQAQIWKGSPFNIERKEGKNPRTAILRFCGPLTARDMHGTLAPNDWQNLLEFRAIAGEGAPGEDPPAVQIPAVQIFDLTDVPYIDSTGLGVIVHHYVRCQTRGIRLIIAGANPRILELFKMTKVDALLPMAATVEEAAT